MGLRGTDPSTGKATTWNTTAARFGNWARDASPALAPVVNYAGLTATRERAGIAGYRVMATPCGFAPRRLRPRSWTVYRET